MKMPSKTALISLLFGILMLLLLPASKLMAQTQDAALPTTTTETTTELKSLNNSADDSPAESTGTDECTIHPQNPIPADGKWYLINGCGYGCLTTGGPAPQILCPRHSDEACMEVRLENNSSELNPHRYTFSVILNPCTQDASSMNRYRVEFIDKTGTEQSLSNVSWSEISATIFDSEEPQISHIYRWR